MAAHRRSRLGLLNPLVIARRNGIYRGLLGGDRTWLVIGALVWAPRLFKRAFGKNEGIVTTERLLPGQAIRLEALPQTTRADRRALQRT